jgi:hypothetical protein
MALGTCDSCGSIDEVFAVHRLYVTPEAWDTPGSVKRMVDVEVWCFACTTHYPHERVETEAVGGPAEDDR